MQSNNICNYYLQTAKFHILIYIIFICPVLISATIDLTARVSDRSNLIIIIN